METGPPPFQFTRHDERRRIRLSLERTLGAAEQISVVDRQVEENVWTYGTPYDLRLSAIDRRSDRSRRTRPECRRAMAL